MPDLPAHLADALRDRYTLERELGRGGVATVYLARDLRHARPVALKVLRPELAALIGRDRFLREIRLTAGLDHPHILPSSTPPIQSVRGRPGYVKTVTDPSP